MLYELSGDWGIEPDRLFAFTLRQLYEYAKGISKRRAIEENYIRRFAYLFAQANSDPKKSLPRVFDFWPIPFLDKAYLKSLGTPQENKDIKTKLMKLWQQSQN